MLYIQQTVSNYYDLELTAMWSKRRWRHIARPRQIAMYLCKKYLNASLHEIAKQFGGKDHTTIIHAIRNVKHLLEENELIKADVTTISDIIDTENKAAEGGKGE